MKKSLNKFLVFGICIGILFTACTKKETTGSSTQETKVYTAKFASTVPGMDPKEVTDVLWGKLFSDYVAEKSGGRLKVDYYGAGQLGAQLEIAQGVSGGSIEIGIVNMAVLTNFDKNFMIFTIPGIFTDADECTAILNSAFGKELFAGLEKQMNFRVSAPACNGFRSFTNSKREVRWPGDMKGLVMRVMQDPVYISNG